MKEKKLKIKPVKKRSMVDQVELNLRDYIKQQDFKPGDALPTENELAQSMGVSRNVVREALSRFKMLGLIASNNKNGIRIIKFDLFPTLERVLDPTVLDKSTLHELFELRIMLEIGMADALFRNVTLKDIEELKDLIVPDESSKVKMKPVEYEIKFHSLLYRITQNETLYGFQKYLKIVFDYVLELESEFDIADIPKPKVSHLELINCLENGTVDQFRKLMYDHFSTYYEMDFFKRTN